METSYISKDDVKFPNFSHNATNFPNSMGPGPIPKKGCESPALLKLCSYCLVAVHVSMLCVFRRSAVGWSMVCDCGISSVSWPYTHCLAFFVLSVMVIPMYFID